jgi:DNA-binding IscR family transcriptional regulator
MEVIDGTTDDDGKTSSASPDSPAVKVLLKTWQEVSAKERQMLQSINLAELLERVKEQDEQMYHI